MALIEMHTYVNRNPYRQYDPESNTYFEPHEPKLAVPTEWLKQQAHIVLVPDPAVAEAPAPTAAEAAAPSTLSVPKKGNPPILPDLKAK